ncbi:MAG: SIR2 family protein [Gammaproteobacteria bacterium]|nr:SIR2 family protein [Gammaproteobacteria bacterium]MYC24503.1 SIR2 family protein [Gammaproteobacteria bacterium]
MQKFFFIRGTQANGNEYEWPKDAKEVRHCLSESLSAKNVAFLLGAGCSSTYIGQKQVGVPTMKPLAKEFTAHRETDDQRFPTHRERNLLKEEVGVDISDKEYSENLESLMELLFSLRFVLQSSSQENWSVLHNVVNSLIRKAQSFLWTKCTLGEFANGDHTVLSFYETFYRKLVLRDRSLPRPWVFTTNYDLFNETAMDRIGLPYANGFSGVIERRFNPATFRYALSEQLDITNRKWSVIDGFVYLCKLHGSITWTEDDHGLFPIRELTNLQNSGELMIYPTPAKQHAILGSPYADLFREFQSQIVREQSVLFTMGYGFGDEHINNIIYQALSKPSFRLVIFADPTLPGELSKLRALNDPRIWIIGSEETGEGKNLHYFETIVHDLLPEHTEERIENAVRRVFDIITPKRMEKSSEP